jgi:hypothetical protein
MRPRKLNRENFEDWPSAKIGPNENFPLYGRRLTFNQKFQLILHEFFLRFARRAAFFADEDRVHIAQPKERDMLTAVATHYITTPPTVMLGQIEREKEAKRFDSKVLFVRLCCNLFYLPVYV